GYAGGHARVPGDSGAARAERPRRAVVARGSAPHRLESIAAALIFAVSVPRVLRFGSQLALPAGLFVGVGFGIVLAWTGAQTQRRVTRRIDRAFFRSAYDARQILEDVAERTREAASREELAALLEPPLRQALHPRSLAI